MNIRTEKIDTNKESIYCEINAFLSKCRDFFELTHGRPPEVDELDNVLKCMPQNENNPVKEIWCIFDEKMSVVGFIDLILKHRTKEQCNIGYFLIDPSFRGQGIGKIALENLLQSVKYRGFSEVLLVVQSQNKKALSFWEREGFCIFEERPGDLTSDIEFVLKRQIM